MSPSNRSAAVADEPVDVESETMRTLGAEIRRIRRDRGLTLQDVATRTGLSISMLSMLERGLAGGSIGTLVSVSSALDVDIGQLFGPPAKNDSPVHRRAQQQQVETKPGVQRRTVHHDAVDGVEIVVLELAAGTNTGRALIRHAGHEYVLVTCGSPDVELDNDRITLEEGDGMRITAGEPHRFVNTTDAPAELVLTTITSAH